MVVWMRGTVAGRECTQCRFCPCSAMGSTPFAHSVAFMTGHARAHQTRNVGNFPSTRRVCLLLSMGPTPRERGAWRGQQFPWEGNSFHLLFLTPLPPLTSLASLQAETREARINAWRRLASHSGEARHDAARRATSVAQVRFVVP